MDLQEFIFYLVWKFDITRFTAFWIYKKKFYKGKFLSLKKFVKARALFFPPSPHNETCWTRCFTNIHKSFTRVFFFFWNIQIHLKAFSISVSSTSRNHQISKNYYTGPALPYLVLLKSLIWANFKISLEFTYNGGPRFYTFLGH